MSTFSFRSEWEVALVQCYDGLGWVAEEPLEEMVTACSGQGGRPFVWFGTGLVGCGDWLRCSKHIPVGHRLVMFGGIFSLREWL